MSLIDLEEDYEANYEDGCRPDPYENTFIPVGTCDRMCSYEEALEREQHGRVHKYEVKAGSNPPMINHKLAIKEFKRSCIGREFTLSRDLRPWSILQKTLNHLLLNISLKDDDWMFVCDFVFDRLKAVRQDMVIQRIEGKRSIMILEGSIRFLVYSMYRLTCTLKDYTKTEPFKPIISSHGPVSGLDNYDMHVVREMKLTMQCLRDCMNSLLVQYEDNVPDSPFRPTFEALHLIINLPFLEGSMMSSTKFQSDRTLRNKFPIFKVVFDMFKEHLSGCHLTALKSLPRLRKYPLLVLAYAPAIALLQACLIKSYRKAYSSPGPNTSTLKYLSNLICPKWLDENANERNKFAEFVAVQFGFYDEKRNLCDYRLDKRNVILVPKNFEEKAQIERVLLERKGDKGNETRQYALQLIFGKDWSFYQSVIKESGVEEILSPN